MLSERALLRLEDIDALISHNECVNAASEIRSLRAKVEAVRNLVKPGGKWCEDFPLRDSDNNDAALVNEANSEEILAILDAKD